MPDLTDYLRASDGNGESVRLIVVADRGVGDLVFNNTTPTNWHTYFIAMAGTVDPVTDRFVEGEYIVFKGHLDGSAVTIDELAPGYVDNGNQEDDIIVIKPTTLWADIVADTMDTVTQAIIDAEAATTAANVATAAANVATGLANTATGNANTATTNANTATGLANTATTNANNAATAATNAANATSWTQGSAVPTGGYDGNFYLRTTTYDVYQKIAGTWTIVANIKGATGSTGATGATGAAGANGSTWYNGSGAPSGGTGVNGDYYWDYTNYKVYTKAAGSWSLLSTISAADANAIKINGSATVTADIPFNAHKLTGVTDPTSAQDAATKNYVDVKDSIRKRDLSTSGTINYPKIQTGWGYLVGSGGANSTVAIVFPVAFTSLPYIQVTLNGYKSGSNPTTVNTTDDAAGWPMNARNITTTGFDATYSQATGSIPSSIRIVFTWIAVGEG